MKSDMTLTTFINTFMDEGMRASHRYLADYLSHMHSLQHNAVSDWQTPKK
jgi:hypothetical protein